MAIIQKCCCCGWTLRRGCYISATFSLIYFFMFTWITGFLTVGRIQSYIFSPETYESSFNGGGGSYNSKNLQFENHVQQQHNQRPRNPEHVIDRISSVTSLPSKSSHSSSTFSSPPPPLPPSTKRKGYEAENNITKRAPYIPLSERNFQVLNQEEIEDGSGISMLRIFLDSDAYAILQTVNLVLDLLCEVAGVYSSVLLIRGLQQERKSWFWPWMIVVPLHIGIDSFTICGIMMEYFANPMHNQLSLVLITILVDVTLNSINVYGLLCVVSQYQEYKAGRGTAAYLEFSSQTPTIMLEAANSTKTVLTKPSSLSTSNRRRSTKDYSNTVAAACNDKNDAYTEELSLQTLSKSNEKPSCLTNENCQQNGKEPKFKNGIKFKATHSGEDSSDTTPNSCVYNNINEITWIEAPPTVAVMEKSDPEPPKSRKASLTTKFGKFLDVHGGKGGGRKQQSQEAEEESGDFSNVVFMPTANSQKETGAILNNKVRTSWLKGEQSMGTHKSDSDSDDPTDDALSAFGIISRDKN